MKRLGARRKHFEIGLGRGPDLKRVQHPSLPGDPTVRRSTILFRNALAIVWMAIAGALLPGAAVADKPVIVVELFTSQGCSSCPAADAFLHKLAKRKDVVALSLHVDYWDYIGWKDVFADHKYTLRQKGYARAGHRRSVYTPQMIIQGDDHVVGNRPMDVTDLISRSQNLPQVVALRAGREGGQVVIHASVNAGAGPGTGPMLVQLVRFERQASVDIRRGENAGRTITYANVVRDWSVIGEWDGAQPLTVSAPVQGDLPLAVIVQKKGFGPIMAAMQVE